MARDTRPCIFSCELCLTGLTNSFLVSLSLMMYARTNSQVCAFNVEIYLSISLTMSPKLKRQRQFEDSLVLAREKKLRCCSDQDESMIKDQFSGTTTSLELSLKSLLNYWCCVVMPWILRMKMLIHHLIWTQAWSLIVIISLTTFVRNGLLISTMKIEFHLVSFSGFSSQVNLERAKKNWQSLLVEWLGSHIKSHMGVERKSINSALDSVLLQSIQKHFRKVHTCVFAYLEVILGGSDLEKLVKKYKKSFKISQKDFRKIII